jgi:purine-nucleoside phosphorylase
VSELAAAVAAVRARTAVAPELALVLGSGLGGLAGAIEGAVAIPADAVPGYPRSTVEGHAGQLVFGRLAGRAVLCVQGRVHLYEGHPPRALGFPVRLAHALGARRLLLTNAAGGLNPAWPPGTFMLVTDHLALAFASPLAGPVGEGEARFADLSAPYDPDWMALAEGAVGNRNLTVRRGVYVWTAGPAYETPAEVRFFRQIGGDAVGMSTVPEAIQAAALGMKVLAISTITNLAAGLRPAPIRHDEVLAVGREVNDDLTGWVRDLVAVTPPV